MKPEIVTVEQSTSILPINILDRAIASGADIANIEKLMDLQDRWERKQAQKAFNVALAKFQADCPEIKKTKRVHYTTRNGDKIDYKYAQLSDIVSSIKETLADCGLCFRFEQSHEDGIKITCILSHIDGHSESTTMSVLADKSGGKNDIQAVGSAVTYLQRYTLISILGITTADEDMDGRLNGDDEPKKTTKQKPAPTTEAEVTPVKNQGDAVYDEAVAALEAAQNMDELRRAWDKYLPAAKALKRTPDFIAVKNRVAERFSQLQDDVK